MKKLALGAVLAGAVASPSAAQFVGPTAEDQVTTVAAAAKARDDAAATLTGHLIEHQRDDHYTFRDDTGTITVEIDDDDFRGQRVTPETLLRLTGEVEHSQSGRYIDVDRVDLP